MRKWGGGGVIEALERLERFKSEDMASLISLWWGNEEEEWGVRVCGEGVGEALERLERLKNEEIGCSNGEKRQQMVLNTPKIDRVCIEQRENTNEPQTSTRRNDRSTNEHARKWLSNERAREKMTELPMSTVKNVTLRFEKRSKSIL